MGKAVVSTTVGAEGLPVVAGEHALIADDPKAFADAVLTLLRDTAQRAKLESAARALVVEHYDWSAVAGELDEALRMCAGRAASSSAGLQACQPAGKKPAKPRRAPGAAKGRRRASA